MNIGDAASRAGLSVKTVRYYDDVGLIRPEDRSAGGYRQYGEVELRKLVFARHARAFGFSIEQTRELLSLYEDRDRSSADVRRIAAARLEEIDARLEELGKLRSELAHLVQACHGDDRPDCPILTSFADDD
ncbi:MAG: Cu(I)-responsive transcriptional regulator [Pseudomonadota bacterium]